MHIFSHPDYVHFLSYGPFKSMDEILSAKYLKTIEARALTPGFVCLFVLFGLYVAFYNLSVISRRCLDVAGSSMLTFRVLPH